MGKFTLVLAAGLAIAASPAWAQDSAQPAAPAPSVQVPSPPAQATPPPNATPEATPPNEPAQNAAQPTAPSRFSFNPVNDGFLRLDNQTGQVAVCSPHMARWVCQAAPEESAALEKEIARLQDEVATLKQQVASLRAPPPPPRPPADLTPPGKDNSAQLREGIGRARMAISNAWRRFVDLVASFQKDMSGKG
jgi:hypothetical protein